MLTESILPNAVYIGFPKSGSTWLAQLLRAHPDVFVPASKELFFFDRYYDRGEDWYRAQFQESNESKVRIDISHDYIFFPDAIERIRKTLPDAILLLFIRNPIDRAFSAYLFAKRNGVLNCSFRESIESDKLNLERYRYAQYIRPYLDQFGDSLNVFFFDDLKRSARIFGQKVLSALQLPQLPHYDYEERVLPASRPRNRHLSHLVKRGAKAARNIGLENVIGRLKKSSAVASVLYEQFPEHEKPKIEQRDYELLSEILSDDIDELSRILDKDLSGWKSAQEL